MSGGEKGRQDVNINMGQAKRLPCGSYAIMVHRRYVDRVVDALIGPPQKGNSWTYLAPVVGSDNIEGGGVYKGKTSEDQPIRKRKIVSSDESEYQMKVGIVDFSVDCVVIPAAEEQGVRKNRRGFSLLLLKNVTMADGLGFLSPFARQNISWASRLSHLMQKNDEDCNVDQAIGEEIFRTISGSNSDDAVSTFQISANVLRVDTYPKEACQQICLKLQRAAILSEESTGTSSSPIYPNNCYEGPITMTKSLTKCTHILTVISLDGFILWGISDKACHAKVKLNHDAAKEVVVEPTHEGTGKDLDPLANQSAPVSRAYYKLTQVWEDIISKENIFSSSTKLEGGIDLGASPGGWTQVLRNVRVSYVLAVDPGMIAKRILSNYSNVYHVAADLSSHTTVKAISERERPLSVLVCDACIDNHLILDKIEQLLEQLPQGSWSLPSSWVITLKFPFKTTDSLQRNIEKIMKAIPSQLQRMGRIAYEGKICARFRIVHLMANSDGERTLIVLWEQAS